MKNSNCIEIHGLSYDNIAYCEAIGLSKCFSAYAEHCNNEPVMYQGIGFNSNSGYTYIALDNGISICSMLGREIEYLFTDSDNGHEYFFDSYHDAVSFMDSEADRITEDIKRLTDEG